MKYVVICCMGLFVKFVNIESCLRYIFVYFMLLLVIVFVYVRRRWIRYKFFFFDWSFWSYVSCVGVFVDDEEDWWVDICDSEEKDVVEMESDGE